MTEDRSLAANRREHWFRLLDGSWEIDHAGRWLNLFMVTLIALNVIMVILASVSSIEARFAGPFRAFEIFSVLVFAVEYVLRLWACTAHPKNIYSRPVTGRLRYALTPLALIDLIAILPFFLQFLGVDLRFLRVFRLLRLLKLTRYFPAMHLIRNVVKAQRRALLSAVFVMLTLLVLASSLMYVVERDAQPEQFSSIPAAMWWGMATLTTVGYGDVVPVTVLGKVIATAIALFGIAMFALPAAIMASGFTQEVRKRDFLTSWKLVAGLPPFARLDATDIADIAELLHEYAVIPDEAVFRAGDAAEAIYFIVAGEVSIRHDNQQHELSSGDFFGEVALLYNRHHVADAVAKTSCRLLVLDSRDFHDLCRDNPALRRHIEGVAHTRLDELNQATDERL